jgi:hypothetical protein
VDYRVNVDRGSEPACRRYRAAASAYSLIDVAPALRRFGDGAHEIGVGSNLAVPRRVARTIPARRREHAWIGEEGGAGEERGVSDRGRLELADECHA